MPGPGDLGAEHVLVEGDRVSGILDWGDLDLGPIGADLVGLWSWAPDAVEARAPEGLDDALTLAVPYAAEDVTAQLRWGSAGAVADAASGLRRRLDRLSS